MSAIVAIRLVSRDATRLAAFYRDALGFADDGAVSGADPYGPVPLSLLRLALGAQHIEIAELDGSADRATGTPDTNFQHMAMVAPRMEAAMARLTAVSGWLPITEGGPQTLPERSGGVTAFKFRDPEGHPLELLTFAPGRIPARWQGAANTTLVGIDHTALVVADTERSVEAYGGLGFRPGGMTLNHGPEQTRLDGVAGGVVEVTSLSIEGAPPPHLELLRYQRADPIGASRASDLSATRTILSTDGSGSSRWCDPDGHRWICGADDKRKGIKP